MRPCRQGSLLEGKSRGPGGRERSTPDNREREPLAKRSPTFRSLIEIDATNGIVYELRGDCRRGARACLVLAIQVADPSRILRVLVKVPRERRALIAAIGHELHHAADVLANPAVTTMEDMFFHFFDRRGSMSITGRFETKEAVRAGMQIENELSARK
jgi:hypothetical protein